MVYFEKAELLKWLRQTRLLHKRRFQKKQEQSCATLRAKTNLFIPSCMTEIENSNFSFDSLPRTVAELHVKIDRLTAMIEQFISSANSKPLPEIMTVDDVAAMLCKSVSTIYAMTSNHRIPYRKQGNKLYFLRSEINVWLTASIVPEDTPKRKRKPHDNGNDDEILPASEYITETNTVGNDVDVTQDLPESHAENSVTASEDKHKNISYSIERRTHSRSGATLFAVLFSNEIEAVGERKFVQTAREFHGYWSDFGNGGYIFNTQQDAENFAKTIRGKERNQGV